MKLSWNGKWTKTVIFKVINIGPIIRDKYSNSLHYFGDEILNNDDKPDGIIYIGPNDKDDKYIEVVYNKDMTNVDEIEKFLIKNKMKIKLVKKNK